MFFRTLQNKIKSYVNRNKIMEELDLNNDILKENITVFNDYAELYIAGKRTPGSEVSKLVNTYYRTVDVKDDPKNFLRDITIKLTRVNGNFDTIRKFIYDNVRNDILTESMTVHDSVSLFLVASLSFINDYSLKFLSYVADDQVEKNDKITANVDTSTVTSMIYPFTIILNELSKKNSEFSSLLKESNDNIINSKTVDILEEMLAGSKLANMLNQGEKSGFIGYIILHTRLYIATIQMNRYKAKVERKKQLELRVMQLKLLNEGKNDPKIQKEIEYIQNRIEKLESDIQQVENKYKD